MGGWKRRSLGAQEVTVHLKVHISQSAVGGQQCGREGEVCDLLTRPPPSKCPPPGEGAGFSDALEATGLRAAAVGGRVHVGGGGRTLRGNGGEGRGGQERREKERMGRGRRAHWQDDSEEEVAH